ncbi:DNA-binding transcription repressor IXR1 Ecym_7252 [Eremothecium cymbalariae DBVPG|uniref:HMG box domain-containing protein n=1 Tax=Eremothecium cymbalariae (strain CBS 270.75 / DBVPG 7215 / KCTC 17166 / NRRL Y-17582) TaxID=931890 RepID=G8JW81_ERECY|nr:hypothetical protein Ecym_7252 [Eremothecium cymbalariae DBVPG\
MNVPNISSPEQHQAQGQLQQQQGQQQAPQHGYYEEDPRQQAVGGGPVMGAGTAVNAGAGGGGPQGAGAGGPVNNNPAVMVAAPGGYYMTPAYPGTIPTLPQQNTQQFSDAMFNSFLAQFGGQRQQQQQQQQQAQQQQAQQAVQQQQYAAAQYMNQFAQSVQGQPQQQQHRQQHHHQQQQGQQGQQPNSQRYFHAAMAAAAGGPAMLEFQPQFTYAIPPQSSLAASQQASAQHHQQQFLQPTSRSGSRAGSARRGHNQYGAGPGAGASANPAPQPKKMSTTQSRIEKRKRLKKQGPKRPSSAYFLFSMSIREELLRQYPDAKVPELSKLSSARWKELSEEDKKPFYGQFKDNWEKYRIAKKEYEATLPPKRPSGPFIQFTSELRPKLLKDNPDKSLIEITKLVGEQWRNLPSEEKQKYTDAYKQKLKEWEEFYPEDDADVTPTSGPATSVHTTGSSTTISVNAEH